MKQLFNQTYEAPLAEVLEVKMEVHLLDGSIKGVQSTREGSYGAATYEEWE